MLQGTAVQNRLLRALRSRDPELRAIWRPDGRAVAHLSGTLSEAQAGAPAEIARSFLRENQALFGFKATDKELGAAQDKTDWHGWHHVTLQQRVGEVPVWSSVVQVHLSEKGAVHSVRSSYRPRIKVDPVPAVKSQDAVRIAAREEGTKAKSKPVRKPHLVIYVYEGKPHLAWVLELRGWDRDISGKTSQPASWLCFVDAHKGELIARFNQIVTHQAPIGLGQSVNNPPLLDQTTKVLRVSHIHSPSLKYRLQDTTRRIETYDAAGADGDAIKGDLSEDDGGDWYTTTGWNSTDHAKRLNCQSAQVDAHDHLGRVYDYFMAKFGRSSLDGAGMTIRAYVHVRTHDDHGNTLAYNNAYWDPNGQRLVFGDGTYSGVWAWDDLTFFSGALDVVAHEYTHGVTHHEIRDADGDARGFTYSGEAGATSEAFSDIFGAFVDRDWRSGDQIVVGLLTAAGHVWRDMADPTRGLAYDPTDTMLQFLAKGLPQPDHYDIRYQGPKDGEHDYGGVHVNCGILNFACYLATHGGVSHRAGRTPEAISVYRSDRLGISVEHAEQIFYLALTEYFDGSPGNGDNRDATFRDMRQAVLDACDQLRRGNKYGVDQCDWNTLNTAFYAVGLHPAGEHYGPDPMITPWGVCTGSGAPYQSPDVWVEDSAGAHTLARKGIVNRLVARISNIGDQPANGVRVRLSYAPFGFGYAHEDFRQIDEVKVSLPAGDTSTVSVNWDLTNLTDNFGGKWPRPVGDFEHFCVRVALLTDPGNDVNTCNNEAQHNFVNVHAHEGALPETLMVIANPFREHSAKVRFILETTVQPKCRVLLNKRPIPKALVLKPGEKRAVKLRIKMPNKPAHLPPTDGFVTGELQGAMPGKFDGQLDEVTFDAGKLTFLGIVRGTFEGPVPCRLQAEIDARIVDSGAGCFEGKLRGAVYELKTGKRSELEGQAVGRFTPRWQVSLGARMNRKHAGGVTVNVVPPHIG